MPQDRRFLSCLHRLPKYTSSWFLLLPSLLLNMTLGQLSIVEVEDESVPLSFPCLPTNYCCFFLNVWWYLCTNWYISVRQQRSAHLMTVSGAPDHLRQKVNEDDAVNLFIFQNVCRKRKSSWMLSAEYKQVGSSPLAGSRRELGCSHNFTLSELLFYIALAQTLRSPTKATIVKEAIFECWLERTELNTHDRITVIDILALENYQLH